MGVVTDPSGSHLTGARRGGAGRGGAGRSALARERREVLLVVEAAGRGGEVARRRGAHPKERERER